MNNKQKHFEALGKVKWLHDAKFKTEVDFALRTESLKALLESRIIAKILSLKCGAKKYARHEDN